MYSELYWLVSNLSSILVNCKCRERKRYSMVRLVRSLEKKTSSRHESKPKGPAAETFK